MHHGLFSQERSYYNKKYSGLFGWMWERVKQRTNHRSGSPQLETGPRKGYTSGCPLTMPDRTPSNHEVKKILLGFTLK